LNKYTHSTIIPTYYNKTRTLYLHNYKDIKWDNITLNSIYTTLMSKKNIVPKIQINNKHLNLKITWSNISINNTLTQTEMDKNNK